MKKVIRNYSAEFSNHEAQHYFSIEEVVNKVLEDWEPSDEKPYDSSVNIFSNAGMRFIHLELNVIQEWDDEEEELLNFYPVSSFDDSEKEKIADFCNF